MPENFHSPETPSLETIIGMIPSTSVFLPEGCNTQTLLQGIATDSRKVVPGGLFIAIDGVTEDGWKYVESALKGGAKAVIASKKITEEESRIFEASEAAYICVDDSRHATSVLAPAFFGFPAKSLRIVGVTGTNGKTTTTTLLYNLFSQMGFRCGLIGTVENRIASEIEPAKLTTPDAISLQELFHRMVSAGCEFLFMEVSSHALVQRRTEGIPFEGAVFTNLTRDHLDYHGDMLSYQKAKKMLFDSLSPQAFALVNADEKSANFMLQNCAARHFDYSLRTSADFGGKLLEMNIDGSELLIDNHSLWVRLTGLFNMYNLMAVYGVARLLLPQLPTERILTPLSLLDHAKGRFEVIRGSRCTAVVDYAHTPDALVKVLETIEEVAPSEARIFAVIGAGGDRDKGKRPIMARETFDRCNQLILTSDNPRFEDPEAIIHDMLEGLTTEERQKTLVITLRREAIRTAILMAKPGDIVLVAGKGHENYQEIRGIRQHFDDSEEIKALIGLPSQTV